MSFRMVMRASIAVAAASAGMALTAPTANAQFVYHVFAASPVGTSLEIAYAITTDSPPFTCKWTAFDLDQFGRVNAGARAYNVAGATFTTTTGPYVSGHRVEVDFDCRDRAGNYAKESGTITIP